MAVVPSSRCATSVNPLLLAVLLAVVPAGGVGAAEVRGLYEAEVRVEDRGGAARKRGFADALVAVIVKVSGRRNPRSNPVVAESLQRADALVQQYSYTIASVPGATAGALPAQELRLRASFDPSAVGALVEDAGLPVWGRTRPSVIVWVALGEGGGRELVGADDRRGLDRVVERAAGRRGIPVVVPLLDVDDRAALRPADVWGGFRDPIETASARYGVEGALAVRAYEAQANVWEGRFKLMLPDVEREWSATSRSAGTLLAAGVAEMADVLASTYAADPGAGIVAGLELTVGGVRTLEDYAAALTYLGALDEVSRVGVRRVEPGQVVFDVDARGGAQALRRVVALGTVLVEEPTLAPGTLGFALRR